MAVRLQSVCRQSPSVYSILELSHGPSSDICVLFFQRLEFVTGRMSLLPTAWDPTRSSPQIINHQILATQPGAGHLPLFLLTLA